MVSQEDVDVIAAIPISTTNDEDKWIWHFCSNGMYSVKSGYKLARRLSVDQESTSNDAQSLWWKALWKAKVPQKIKIFIWKAFHGCLPTMYSLWRRGVDTSPVCHWCRVKWETVDHALCGCNRSKQICDNMFPRIDLHIPVGNNFADRISHLARCL